jgi:hypothetical protein
MLGVGSHSRPIPHLSAKPSVFVRPPRELRAAMSLARLWRDQGKRTVVPVYGWFPCRPAMLRMLFLEGHAFEVTALELLAGSFRPLLVEAGEARTIEYPITCLHALSEWVGRSEGADLQPRLA